MYQLLLILVVSVFASSASAYERVVLLAPAAGDLFIQLGAKAKVVGVTRSNDDFPDALKVGSHIKPNVELIKGLTPDLLVISSNRFFSELLAEQVDADVIQYNPINLDEILTAIDTFGVQLGKEREAQVLVDDLRDLQDQIKPLANKPYVVFEVTESPFTIAGKSSIVNGIIEAAGGMLIAPSERSLLKYNVESVLIENPDYYIYQIGPMNKNPTPPLDRPNYQLLHSNVIKVDQLDFSRATTRSFHLALELNLKFMHSWQD